MKIKHIIITFLLGLNFLPACTSFVLEQDGSYYLAKNLDWEIDRGYVFYNLDGIEKTSISDPDLKWISKYKSISNNQFGKEFPLGGVNEKGLAIEELNSYRQGYEYDDKKYMLNEFQWIQYQLDNSASVRDVIKSFETITIKHDLIELHYIVADSSGKVAVVECLKGGVKIYVGDELTYKVLSNNNYEKSVKYLEYFAGYGGDAPIKKDLSSQGRFVTAVSMLDNLDNMGTAMEKSFNILNTIKQWDTRWQFVYDMKNKKISYKTHDLTRESKISFKELKHIKHNRLAITLFGGEHKRVKMNAEMNEEHLKIIQDRLEEYFPGKEHVYDLMMEAGERSLNTKPKRQTPISN